MSPYASFRRLYASTRPSSVLLDASPCPSVRLPSELDHFPCERHRWRATEEKGMHSRIGHDTRQDHRHQSCHEQLRIEIPTRNGVMQIFMCRALYAVRANGLVHLVFHQSSCLSRQAPCVSGTGRTDREFGRLERRRLELGTVFHTRVGSHDCNTASERH